MVVIPSISFILCFLIPTASYIIIYCTDRSGDYHRVGGGDYETSHIARASSSILVQQKRSPVASYRNIKYLVKI